MKSLGAGWKRIECPGGCDKVQGSGSRHGAQPEWKDDDTSDIRMKK